MANIAIISPSQNAYSETFIQAHKNYLDGNIFYYYGDRKNLYLENYGKLSKHPKAFFYRLNRLIQKKTYGWYFDQLLIQSLKKNKIDIVLAEYGTTGEHHLGAIKALNLPLVVHFHGYDASINHIIKENNNYRNIFGYSKFIVVVSSIMYSKMREIGCPEEKLVLNYYGPNEEFNKIEAKFTQDQIIAVGRFVDKKAPYYLILAFINILEDFPDTKLIIAGKGILWNTCKNLIRAYGLEKNIILPGIITPNQFKEYLKESLIFVQHSITAEDGNSEGTPLAILEASAAGLPIVSTLHAGIPDVVIDGETGFLVEEHDYLNFSNKIKYLLRNKREAKKMGANGKINIAKNFSMSKHINCLNSLLSI